MLNFVICDDNINILDRLTKMLDNIFMKYNYDAKVGFASENPEEVISYINNNKANVLFLDINLKSNKSGLEIAEEIRKKHKNIYLVFTTGHLEYAMMAYKFKTFDYLAKPITADRLEDTIKRLFEDIEGSPKRYIKIDNKNTIIDENEILYIKRDGMKLIFHTANREYDTYSSFNKLQDTLPENFVRCHKSFIININRVTNVDPVTNMIYFENCSCSIGPKYKKELMEVFNKYGSVK